MFVIDADTRISFMNHAASALYSDAQEGDLFGEIIESKKCQNALQRVLDGAANETLNVTLQQVVPTAFRVVVSRLDADRRSAEPSCMVSFEDISHIQDAQQMRQDFVANVSHELRSPLTALSGFIQTLQGPAADDKNAQVRFLRLMGEETDRMSRLVGDLLSLSKLQASERNAHTDAIDLRNVLQRVHSSLIGLAAEDQIDLRLDLGDDIPPRDWQ